MKLDKDKIKNVLMNQGLSTIRCEKLSEVLVKEDLFEETKKIKEVKRRLE